MLSSLVASSHWDLPPKLRLSTALAQPIACRVAPSPTGHVHLGTLRTALHNALAARASGGSFVLRIDDTDQQRNQAGQDTVFHDCLLDLGLQPDRVFHQSSRGASHHAAVQALLGCGLAQIDGSAVRLAPAARALAPPRFFDLASGVCSVSPTLVDHADGLVLLRSDGSPTYHLASVVDDIDAGITLILRGMDHLANVPKQVILARALACAGYPGAQAFCDQALFAHVGLVLVNGKKLSKRDAASNVLAYLSDGVPPGALLHWALALGWGHPDAQFDKRWPVLPLADMPGVFASGGLRSANSTLNLDRLANLSKKYRRAAV